MLTVSSRRALTLASPRHHPVCVPAVQSFHASAKRRSNDDGNNGEWFYDAPLSMAIKSLKRVSVRRVGG